ncbi:MAG: hypothetical protein IID44_17260 [Planctomycetes bacterium]|nr:hypothetical protein [Planctomycetota bacterium]
MIRRLFRLLLVPLMLANQGLCVAHAHHGTDVAEPEGHAARSHIHLGGRSQPDSTNDHEHHGDHSHGDHSGCDHRPDKHDAALPSAIAPIGEHDADAVYGMETIILARNGRTVTVVSTTNFAASAILRVTHQSDDWLVRLGPLRGQPPSVFDAACPIYLRTLSLRI